jgi:hypothetical protein
MITTGWYITVLIIVLLLNTHGHLPYCNEHEKLKLGDTQQTKLFIFINTQGMAEKW